MRIFNIVFSLIFGRLRNRRHTKISRRDVLAWYRPL
jgi:intein-encoded DNA endonuclease-like protein